MVLNAQVRNCELRGHEENFPDPLDSFGKIKISVFMDLEAQIRTCELRGHEKKKKKIFSNPSTSKSQVRICGVNFVKIKIFVFYEPKGTGLDI